MTRCSTRWLSTPADAGQIGDPSSWLKVTRTASFAPQVPGGSVGGSHELCRCWKKRSGQRFFSSSFSHLLEVPLRNRDLAPRRMSLVPALPKKTAPSPPPQPQPHLQTQCRPEVRSNVTFPTKWTLALTSTQSSELLKNSQSNEARGFLQSNTAFAF